MPQEDLVDKTHKREFEVCSANLACVGRKKIPFACSVISVWTFRHLSVFVISCPSCFLVTEWWAAEEESPDSDHRATEVRQTVISPPGISYRTHLPFCHFSLLTVLEGSIYHTQNARTALVNPFIHHRLKWCVTVGCFQSNLSRPLGSAFGRIEWSELQKFSSTVTFCICGYYYLRSDFSGPLFPTAKGLKRLYFRHSLCSTCLAAQRTGYSDECC